MFLKTSVTTTNFSTLESLKILISAYNLNKYNDEKLKVM